MRRTLFVVLMLSVGCSSEESVEPVEPTEEAASQQRYGWGEWDQGVIEVIEELILCTGAHRDKLADMGDGFTPSSVSTDFAVICRDVYELLLEVPGPVGEMLLDSLVEESQKAVVRTTEQASAGDTDRAVRLMDIWISQLEEAKLTTLATTAENRAAGDR